MWRQGRGVQAAAGGVRVGLWLAVTAGVLGGFQLGKDGCVVGCVAI